MLDQRALMHRRVHVAVPLPELELLVDVLLVWRDDYSANTQHSSADARLADHSGSRVSSGHDLAHAFVPPGHRDGRIAALPQVRFRVLQLDVDVLGEAPEGRVFGLVFAVREFNGAHGRDADRGLAPADPAPDHADVVDVVVFSRVGRFVARVRVAVAFGVFVDVEAQVRAEGAEAAGGHVAEEAAVEHLWGLVRGLEETGGRLTVEEAAVRARCGVGGFLFG